VGLRHLEGIHGDHFRVQVAAEVRGEHLVAPLGQDLPVGVEQDGTHTVVSIPSGGQRRVTDREANPFVWLVGRLL
jgi:hypothetical protein